jgi:hypothetical protein
MQKLEQYIPIGLQVFSGIVSIINPLAGTVLAGLTGLFSKLWGDLTKTISDYNAAPAAGKATALEQVLTALDAVQGNLAKILSDVNANSTAAQVAKAALLLLTSTLAAIEAQLAPQAAPKAVGIDHLGHANLLAVPHTVSIGSNQLIVKPATSRADFIKQHNNIMLAAGYTDRQLH